MYCSECGQKLPDDAKFCANCGHPVKPSERPAEGEDKSEEPTAQPPAEEPEEPATAAYETAREGAAEEAAEVAEAAQAPEQSEEPAAEEAPPAAATPQPTPQPRPTPAAPEAEQPSSETEEPTQAQPPPPPQAPSAGAQPPEEKPKGGGTRCLIIGCIVLIVLGIIAAIAVVAVGRWGMEKAQDMPSQIQRITNDVGTATNRLEIREPGDAGDSGDADESGDAGETGDSGAESAAEGIGEMISGMGEAIEKFGQAMSAADIAGFEPSDVDPAMVPTFYGFMGALAADSGQGMYVFMSPELKRDWGPSHREASPDVEHVGFRVVEHEEVSDTEHRFLIAETIRKTDAGEQGDIGWTITFKKVDNRWYVDDFGSEEL